MFKKLILLGLGSLIAAISSANAQQTGSFDTTIQFSGAKRTLSCYVPTNYNKPALVVSLHGAMDNSTNMRKVLIGQTRWDTLFTNTIIIFPDGAELATDPNDAARDFYAPVGDEAIIDSTIAWAKAQYNIDESQIYLHGFSLGGRSALKWGLDNPTKIAGLVLNTPAVQSPMDVQNQDGYSLKFNYSNANKLKRISMDVGGADIGFMNTVNMLADSLVEHNAKLFFVILPQLTHSITPNELTSAMFEYTRATSTESRAELYKFETEPFYNTNKLSPKALVRNIGFSRIDSLTITYTINGIEKQQSWKGLLNPGDHASIILPEETLPIGNNEIEGYISKFDTIDYEKTDIVNDQSASFEIFAPAKQIPFKDDFSNFDESDNNWSVKQSGNYISWAPAKYLFTSSVNAIAMLNTQLAYTNFGLTESLYSNVFDFSKATKPAISFDVAYNYTHYSSTYFPSAPNGLDFMDTLELKISKDNGVTFSSLAKLWGEQLRTFKTVFTDYTAITNFTVAPKSDEWKTLTFYLTNLDVSEATQFRFDYISGSGGVIYLTNIQFFDEANTSVADRKVNDFAIYPNPANSVVNVPQELIESSKIIEIFNALGAKVLSESANSAINIETLPNGIYTIKIGDKSSSFVIAK